MKTDTFICIAGKNNIACEALSILVENKLARNDRILALPNSSGENSWMESLSKTAGAYRVSLLKDEMELYGLNNLLFISLEYDKIIDPDKFHSPELFNIHFSKLPAYKGCHTSAWPIIKGESLTAVTLHKIDGGIDTGDILDQIEFPIQINDTARDLYFKYNYYGVELFKKNIRNILENHYQLIPQPTYGSTYYSRESLNFKNLKIDLRNTAFQIHNQVRAFIFPEYQLPSVYGHPIIKSKIMDQRSTQDPGRVVFEDEQSLEIATIDFNLKLYKKDHVQLKK